MFRASEVVDDRELRQVAVKLIPGEPQTGDRAQAEARAAASLKHPHLLTYLASGECLFNASPFLYLVMELA